MWLVSVEANNITITNNKTSGSLKRQNKDMHKIWIIKHPVINQKLIKERIGIPWG